MALETKEIKLQRHIEDWREKMLGPQDAGANTGFWLDGEDEEPSTAGAIRVLVCGNTVGRRLQTALNNRRKSVLRCKTYAESSFPSCAGCG